MASEDAVLTLGDASDEAFGTATAAWDKPDFATSANNDAFPNVTEAVAGSNEPSIKAPAKFACDILASDGAQSLSLTDIAVWRDWVWWSYENPVDPDSFLYCNGNGTLTLFVADTDNHRIRKISGTILYDENGDKMWTAM